MGIGDRPSHASSFGTSGQWDEWYRKYRARLVERLQPLLERCPERTGEIERFFKPYIKPVPQAVERFEAATGDDVQWLTAALRDDARKWFVADAAAAAAGIPEDLCTPMLDAAVEELDPSFDRRFVEPCMRVFGARCVNEYLLEVLESGDSFQKAGAVCALNWAQISIVYEIKGRPISSLTIEDATPDSLAAFQALSDIWQRKKKLFVETFVFNTDVDVRRVLFGRLHLDDNAYEDTHKPLVRRAIEIGRLHPDEYIRQQFQLYSGETNLMPALPPRRPRPAHG
jgi:hypothetical protein